MTRSVGFDLVSGVSTYVTDGQGGLFGEGAHRWDENGTVVSHDLRRELTIAANDPLSARYALRQSYEMGREGWRIRIESDTAMSAMAPGVKDLSSAASMADTRNTLGPAPVTATRFADLAIETLLNGA